MFQRALRINACTLLLAGLCLAACQMTAGAAEESKKAATTEVKLGDLKLNVPATWKQEEPSSRLRLGQFSIPAVEGDKDAAELTIFSFGASGVKANVLRWINQFAAEGRKAKTVAGEATLGQYVFVDISGTYNKPVGPPIQGKTEATPGSRMLAVILVTKEKGTYYFLKMAGPDKTVAAQAKALRTSFGGNAEKEKEIDFEE